MSGGHCTHLTGDPAIRLKHSKKKLSSARYIIVNGILFALTFSSSGLIQMPFFMSRHEMRQAVHG